MRSPQDVDPEQAILCSLNPAEEAGEPSTGSGAEKCLSFPLPIPELQASVGVAVATATTIRRSSHHRL